MRATVEALGAAYEEIAAISFLSLPARVARAVARLADQVGDPIPAERAGCVSLCVRQGDIAAFAGLSRETVVRVIADLRRKKILEPLERGTFVVDLPRLEVLVQFEECRGEGGDRPERRVRTDL